MFDDGNAGYSLLATTTDDMDMNIEHTQMCEIFDLNEAFLSLHRIPGATTTVIVSFRRVTMRLFSTPK